MGWCAVGMGGEGRGERGRSVVAPAVLRRGKTLHLPVVKEGPSAQTEGEDWLPKTLFIHSQR